MCDQISRKGFSKIPAKEKESITTKKKRGENTNKLKNWPFEPINGVKPLGEGPGDGGFAG